MPLMVGFPTMTFGFIVIRDNRFSAFILAPHFWFSVSLFCPNAQPAI
jgi:hypothetical protein